MFYAIAGLLIITVGLAVLFPEIALRIKCSRKTEGKIVSTYVKTECTGRGGAYVKYYYPVYEYEVNGRKYIGKPNQYSKYENWYKLGDVAQISYNPGNPEEMTTKRFFGGLLMGGAFILAGTISLIIYYVR